MNRVFISYRRDDSADVTGRIFDRLRAHFEQRLVFRDVDGIPLGTDFRAVIRSAVEECRVLIAVIGPTWISVTNEDGCRRLDDPDDFVRTEIETALQRSIPVIPVLVGRSHLPKVTQLPTSLQPLSFRNALEVRRDPDFHRDIDRLIRGLDEILGAQPCVVNPAELQRLINSKPQRKRWENLRNGLTQIQLTRSRIPKVSRSIWTFSWQVAIFALLCCFITYCVVDGENRKRNYFNALSISQSHSTEEFLVLPDGKKERASQYYSGFDWEPTKSKHLLAEGERYQHLGSNFVGQAYYHVRSLPDTTREADRLAAQQFVDRANAATKRAAEEYAPQDIPPVWAKVAMVLAFFPAIFVPWLIWFQVIPYFERWKARRLTRNAENMAARLRKQFPAELATFGIDPGEPSAVRQLIDIISAHLNLDNSVIPR